MVLEARSIVFQDIVTNVLTYGYRKRPEEFFQEIGNVTEEDIVKFVKKIYDTPLTIRGIIKYS